MDELKKYLQQHVHEMDLDEPSPQILQRVITAGNTGKTARIRPFWYGIAAAASVTLLLVLGIKIFRTGSPVMPGNALQEASKTAAVKENNIPVTSFPSPAGSDTSHNTGAAFLPVPGEDKTADDREPYRLLSSFESHYTKMVTLQLQSIRQSPLYGEPAGYFEDLKNQLRKMGEDEAAVKTNIRQTGLTDALLTQLITVYQQKISLLKNIQAEINHINQKVKENHQPGDSLITSYVNI
ncbi:MAG: hypothetical protein U0V75_05155 [Ferruginibacter sp.]